MRTTRAGSFLAAALTVTLATVSACAYFNTLYNAKQKFKEAKKTEARAASTAAQAQPRAPGGPNPNARAYEEVVEKCKSMIANYPDSKHVDDAMLLSAKALYELGRYDEAVAALDTLERRFPKSNLRDDTAFLKGKSLHAAQKYDLAAPVLRDFARDHRKDDHRPEALSLLCASLMELDASDEAVAALATLEKDHGRSPYRFRAQVQMADILARKELYDASLAVYRRLSVSRIPESYRYDVWLGMARVQSQVGDHQGAIETLDKVGTLTRAPDKEPIVLLQRAKSHAALDSLEAATAEYKDVAVRFARGVYAAEAYYRLGGLYESMDSLQTAQRNYQEVPRAYSGSEFADDAIKRSGDIGRVLRVQESAGDESPEAIAMRTFSMAEIQFFQFENPQKAIPSYEKVVNEFPQSEYAPRAVYALGYIHGVVLGDTAKAREWYGVLKARYPESAQAQLAYGFYRGASPPPPVSEWVQKKKPAAAAPADPSRPPGQEPPPLAPPVPTPRDTVEVPPANPPADTTTAPADTSGGG